MSCINHFKKEDCRGIDKLVEDCCSSCYFLYFYLGISGRDSFKGDRSVTSLFDLNLIRSCNVHHEHGMHLFVELSRT
jgi:hypothetical protein